MEIPSEKVKIYFGRGVGLIIEEYLTKAKQKIRVVSPWISPKYMEALIRKKEEGVDVKIVTSDDTRNRSHFEALGKLINWEKSQSEEMKFKQNYIIASSLFFLLGLLLLYIKSLSFLIPLSIGGVLLWLGRYKEIVEIERISGIKLDAKIFSWESEGLHSKIYIFDNIAIIGSANFTEKGLFRNIEVIIVSEDENVVKTIEEKFEDIWNNPTLTPIDIKNIFSDRVTIQKI